MCKLIKTLWYVPGAALILAVGMYQDWRFDRIARHLRKRAEADAREDDGPDHPLWMAALAQLLVWLEGKIEEGL